jgi:hypothetical protein
MNTKRNIAAQMFKRAQENARLQRSQKTIKNPSPQLPEKKEQ